MASDERSVGVVTGATGAIGEAIARGLVDAGWRVVLAVRDETKGAALASRLAARGGDVRVELVDVGLRSSIDRLAARWRGPVHALVNNAAITPRRREVTEEGVERQLAVNVLGYVRMIRALEPALAADGRGRVVNVASHYAGDLDEDDLEFARRRYDNDAAYRQSKQANRMLTITDAERLASRGIAVNACHPGVVTSALAGSLGFTGPDSPDEGAATPLHLAREVENVSGKFFSGRAQRADGFARDRAAIERLAERIARYG